MHYANNICNGVQIFKFCLYIAMRLCCFQWLCPKRKKEEGPYDVHEQTFEMDENFGYIQQSEKNQPDPSARSVQTDAHKQQSSQSLNLQPQASKASVDNLQDDEKKFMENKNKIEQQPMKAQQSVAIESVPTSVPQAPQKIEAQPKPQQKPKTVSNVSSSLPAKKKFNPEDYFFKNENDEFKVKPVGSLNEQQFNIDNCKNGTYFVFDNTANIYIDDCQNCFIFAGPCQSSIFVRSCKNMVIVGITGQFRTYNCHDCHFSIYCKSQPVIQSSSNLHFSHLQCPEYPQLWSQFKKANLFPWNNNWTQIHNFTKKQGEVHHVLDRQPQYKLQIDWQRAFSMSKTSQSKPSQQIVPFIQDLCPMDHQPKKALIIFSQQMSKNDEKIMQWVLKNKIKIIRASKSKTVSKNYLTVALLIDQSQQQGQEQMQQQIDYEQVGNPNIIREADQVKLGQAKYFINFKDQR